MVLLSCDNSTLTDCVKSSGKFTSQEVSLPPFSNIVLNDDIDFYLQNGTDQTVIIKAGKNLIPKIGLEVKENTLYISNHNYCNWVREPGNPGIYVYSDAIAGIESYSYNNVNTLDTFRIARLDLFSDGNGNFNNIITGDSLFIRSDFVSNFTISGKIKFLHIDIYEDSQFHGRNLIGEWIEVYQKGSNMIEVFPVTALEVRIVGTGSIYYYNEAVRLDVNITGEGKLIRK